MVLSNGGIQLGTCKQALLYSILVYDEEDNINLVR